MSTIKSKPIRSKQLRDSALGESCTLRLPGICNHDTDTVVLCHLRHLSSAGIGQKPDDTAAVYACSACHDAIDGRTRTDMTQWEIGHEEGRAMIETQRRMFDKGLIQVKGAK